MRRQRPCQLSHESPLGQEKASKACRFKVVDREGGSTPPFIQCWFIPVGETKMGTKFKFHLSNLKYSQPCLNRCTFHLAGIDIFGCQDKSEIPYVVHLNNRVSMLDKN